MPDPIYVAVRHPLVRLLFTGAGTWTIVEAARHLATVPTAGKTGQPLLWFAVGPLPWIVLMLVVAASVLDILLFRLTFFEGGFEHRNWLGRTKFYTYDLVNEVIPNMSRVIIRLKGGRKIRVYRIQGNPRRIRELIEARRGPHTQDGSSDTVLHVPGGHV